jgi:site-specific recombinase XerD
VVDSIAKLAGIDPAHWSPHYFRHAFAIEALRKTGNLATVQDLLGHSSPHSTRIYAKIYDEDLEAAYRDVFDR